MNNQKLTIPMSEEDCQDIIDGGTFDWVFTTDRGEDIDIHIKLEEQEDLE